MSNNVYSKQSLFDIAKNEEKEVFLYGVWYRHDATEYAVFTPGNPSKRFDNLRDALAYFEEMTK